jgi:hypothetical protein
MFFSVGVVWGHQDECPDCPTPRQNHFSKAGCSQQAQRLDRSKPLLRLVGNLGALDESHNPALRGTILTELGCDIQLLALRLQNITC